jgi:putative FmdB family regulatory protein
MPLYDYRCTACGYEVEVMHSVHGKGPEVCERCGGPMRKALSPPAIHFKGSGWAKKDARSSSGRAGSGASDATAKAGDKATGAGSDGGSAPKAGTGGGTDASTAGSDTTGSGSA